jgi:hypothetical protein
MERPVRHSMSVRGGGRKLLSVKFLSVLLPACRSSAICYSRSALSAICYLLFAKRCQSPITNHLSPVIFHDPPRRLRTKMANDHRLHIGFRISLFAGGRENCLLKIL